VALERGPHPATGVLAADGRSMPTLHEMSDDDGASWRPAMRVTLERVA
jgi:hypothetical protein